MMSDGLALIYDMLEVIITKEEIKNNYQQIPVQFNLEFNKCNGDLSFKQQKDYDMVRNERDILGTQLIKRNQ